MDLHAIFPPVPMKRRFQRGPTKKHTEKPSKHRYDFYSMAVNTSQLVRPRVFLPAGFGYVVCRRICLPLVRFFSNRWRCHFRSFGDPLGRSACCWLSGMINAHRDFPSFLWCCWYGKCVLSIYNGGECGGVAFQRRQPKNCAFYSSVKVRYYGRFTASTGQFHWSAPI